MDTSPEDILRFYGRRKGKKLRDRRLAGIEDILPQIKIEVGAGELNLPALFPFPVRDVWMEIGFGDGKHLIDQALANPDVGFIGCEPFLNGIASLCADIQDAGIKNIRIWPDDARLLMQRLPSASLGKCFLLNSDPWPKNRHAKRRFVQQETLDDIHRILKKGSLFRMSSDHSILVSWQLEKTYFHGGFSWNAKDASDWRDRPADLPETRYQKKGATEGRPTIFLNFTRV